MDGTAYSAWSITYKYLLNCTHDSFSSRFKEFMLIALHKPGQFQVLWKFNLNVLYALFRYENKIGLSGEKTYL